MRLTPGDIEAIFNAIRPRLKKLISGGSFATSPPTTAAPHTHHASEIELEPAGVEWTGYVDADDVQEGIEELDDEKLARSGVQPMRGNLSMDDGLGPWQIEDVLDVHLTGGAGNGTVDGVRLLEMAGGVGEARILDPREITMDGDVGEADINNVRVLHMIGDDGDNEARIDGLDRVVFNATTSQAILDSVSRAEWNTGVTPGTDYTLAEGVESWSDLEGTMVVNVASGPGS